MFASAPGLALGLALHALWFTLCERLTPLAGAPTRAAWASQPEPVPAAAVVATARKPTPPPGPATGFIQTGVIDVIEETDDVRTFRLARPPGFEFLPGQFLAIRVRVDAREHVRCYSISSAPSASGFLEISVKRQGLVSSMLHATLRPGSTAAIRRPAGAFVYPAGDDRPLLLIAGGIGITPLRSMLRHAIDAEPSRPVALLYSSATPQSFAFLDEFNALARRHRQVRMSLAATRGGGGPAFYAGRIDESLIRTVMPEFHHSVAMLCGPDPMIRDLRRMLSSMGLPPASIRSELFEPAVAATSGHQPAEATAPARAAGLAAHRVRCRRSGKDVTADPRASLLEALEAGGVPIDSLCRSGVCGTCRTRVLTGEVDCVSTVLDANDRSAGFVLACVTRARGDCEVDL
jgi:ferredoxin-NADP reductase